MYKVRASSRAVFITRNNNTVQLEGGQPFTAEEFKTIKSEAEVVCIDEATGQLYTVVAGKSAPAPVAAAPVEPPAPVELPAPEAPDAGVTPSSVETGSKDSQA